MARTTRRPAPQVARYEHLHRFESHSSPGKWHTVSRDVSTGALTCTCPVWVFNRNGDRTCYHTERVRSTMLGAVQASTPPVTAKATPEGAQRVFTLDDAP